MQKILFLTLLLISTQAHPFYIKNDTRAPVKIQLSTCCIVKNGIETPDTRKQDFFWLAPNKIIGLLPKQSTQAALAKGGAFMFTREPDQLKTVYKIDRSTIDTYFIIRSQGVVTFPSTQLQTIKQIANFFFDQFAAYDMNERISEY
jgi:hypothetical protein